MNYRFMRKVRMMRQCKSCNARHRAGSSGPETLRVEAAAGVYSDANVAAVEKKNRKGETRKGGKGINFRYTRRFLSRDVIIFIGASLLAAQREINIYGGGARRGGRRARKTTSVS